MEQIYEIAALSKIEIMWRVFKESDLISNIAIIVFFSYLAGVVLYVFKFFIENTKTESDSSLTNRIRSHVEALLSISVYPIMIFLLLSIFPFLYGVIGYQGKLVEEYIYSKEYMVADLESYHFPAFQKEKVENSFDIMYINPPLEKKYVEFVTESGETFSGKIAVEIHQNNIDPYIEYKELEIDVNDIYTRDKKYDVILHMWSKQE